MNAKWQDFLTAYPTQPEPDYEPGLDAPEQASALIALTERASIHVAGAEAADFLQAMLTQDVLSLKGDRAVRSALCNAKGRTCSVLLVHPVEDGYRLTLPAELAPDVLKLLRMYVLRRKVTIEEEPDWVQIGLVAPPESLPDVDVAVPQTAMAQHWAQIPGHDDVLLTREERGPLPRLSIQGPVATLKQLWQILAPTMHVGATNEWTRAEIADGLPAIGAQTWAHFVPQWLNLDQLDAVNFKKGCYPGQEVIARMHYLGKPNRRMVAGHVDLAEPLTPGTEILLKDGKAAGEVVRSAPHGQDSQDLLAVIRLNHLSDDLQIAGQPLTLQAAELVDNDAENPH